MSAPAIIGWLFLAAAVIAFCLTETPAVARSRDDVDVEDEATGWGSGDEF